MRKEGCSSKFYSSADSNQFYFCKADYRLCKMLKTTKDPLREFVPPYFKLGLDLSS